MENNPEVTLKTRIVKAVFLTALCFCSLGIAHAGALKEAGNGAKFAAEATVKFARACSHPIRHPKADSKAVAKAVSKVVY